MSERNPLILDEPEPAATPPRTRPERPGGKTSRRKRSPALPNRHKAELEGALEPAAGGPAPNLLQKQFTPEEWEYLENLPPGSLAEEIKLLRVLSLRLVQQGLRAEDPGDEIRYYSEATRIMARLPALLKAERALHSEQDDLTLAMVAAIQTVLEEVENKKARQLELPLMDQV